MFSQEKKLNIAKCNGCKEKCVLDALKSEWFEESNLYYPMIGGKMIKTYTNRWGYDVLAITKGRENTIKRAFEIAKLCDNYNTISR